MKKLINIDSSTIIPFKQGFGFIITLIIVGIVVGIIWKTRGVVVYGGIVAVLAGLFMMYMGITDETL